MAVLLTIALGLTSWSFSELAALKERVARGESEREYARSVLQEIRTDLREIQGDIRRLLEGKKN